MLFSELVKECLDERIKPEVEKLLRLKMSVSEMGEGDTIESINAYIEESLEEIAGKIEALPSQKSKSWDGLNEAFLSLLEGLDYIPLCPPC